MPFPFSSQQSFTVQLRDSLDQKHIVHAVEAALEDVSAADLIVRPTEISFRGGIMRFVSNVNSLNAIATGVVRFSFSADKAVVSAHLQFTRAGVIGAFLLALVIPFSTAAYIRSALLLVLAFYLCLLAFSYTSARAAFARLLRKAADLQKHPEPQAHQALFVR